MSIMRFVEKYILDKIKEKGAVHFSLIDPEKSSPEDAANLAKIAERAGSDAIMIGGSINVTESMLDSVIRKIKEEISLPVILFPGNVNEISKYADAIWFLSVLNSISIYHIIGAQAQAAPIIKRYKLEAIPLAYLICGEGGAAGYVSYSRPFPFKRPEIAATYALAAQLLGFHFVYLEGGSGGAPIPSGFIRVIRRAIDIPFIVGGGIKDKDLASKAVSAGADAVVTGTILEKTKNYKLIKSIVEGIKEGVKKRSRELISQDELA